MRYRMLTCLALAVAALACGDSTVAPKDPAAHYELVEENGHPLPTNPVDPYGCCLTLSATLTFGSETYELHGFYRNLSTGDEFENIETGTYTRDGATLYFTRTGGSGLGSPYLLAPGTLSDGNATITLLYGDEGPGSNQIRGVFKRAGEAALP